MAGPTRTTTQAPSLNFTVAKMSTMMAVSTADRPFTTTPRRHRPVRWSRWCLTMPDPAMANPVNTPMAYRATRLFTWALVASSRMVATTVSTRIPLEKARRWPRRVSWRGR